MKTIKYFVFLLLILLGWSCENDYISELFIDPVAKFELMPGAEVEVLGPVQFQNQGIGQNFVVYPGDKGHIYGQPNNTGFVTDISGKFTYYYDEMGTYSATWVATSIKKDGTVVTAVSSVEIRVVATEAGFSHFVIPNIYRMSEYSTAPSYSSYGVFVSPNTIMCPITYASWASTSRVYTIKRAFAPTFDLTAPTTTRVFWVDKLTGNEIRVYTGSAVASVWFVTPRTTAGANVKLEAQEFITETYSGLRFSYFVVPVMIPNFTKFSVTIGENTYTSTYDARTIVEADNTITRDGSFYNRFYVNLTLPQGTDLSALIPNFDVVNNDVNLTDGSNIAVSINGVSQTSGVSVVNLSSRAVTYNIRMGLLGDSNPNLIQEAQMFVNIKLQ